MKQTLLIAVLALSASSAGLCQSTDPESFWTNSTLPGTLEATNDSASVTLGLQFYSDVPGSVTGVRFYKGPHNTGTHVGNLWSNTGTKLAEVTFSGETASGWQQANFSSPVSITASTTYVISYLAPNGNYAVDQSYPWSSVSAAPLHVSGSTPGVFAYGSAASFPNGTWNGSNYWIDPVFVPAAPSVTQTSFWTNSTVPGTPEVSNDIKTVTLGLQFSSTVSGSVTGVRFYKGADNTGQHIGTLWSGTGTKLAEVTFSGETASGWQQAKFATPVNIAANTTYVISYLAPKGTYAADKFYAWTSLSAPPLRVSGTSPGVFAYGSGTTFPNSSWKSNNYWVDVVFSPADSTSTYSISGKVSGSAATVTLSGTASASTTTDSAGNFSFSGLKNGAYTVAPSQSGYVFTPASASVSINGASMTGVNFTATASSISTYSISGKISGSAATVQLTGTSSATTATDGAGNYSFSGLKNGSYTVAPSQSGYVFTPTSAPVSINGVSIAGVNFTATATSPSTYSISGKVSGSVATLTLSGTSSASTTTDSAGNYSFSGLKNGSYTITPSQSGSTFTPASAAVSINSASITGVNFTASTVHSVLLTWNPSTSSSISGYNLYRGTVSGGPYTKITGSLVTSTSFVDTGVASGQTYFYVATTMASSMESSYSTEVKAVVPTP